MSPAGRHEGKHTPSIAWDDRLTAWNLHTPYVIVGQPEFFSGMETLLKKTPVPVLRDYLRFHLVSNYAPYLNKDFDQENFNFYHRVLSGQKEPRPRWKRVIDAENAAMGMVLGKIFVKEYFPEAAKKAVLRSLSKRFAPLTVSASTASNG